ncbi:flavin reductase family protein [Mangrovicoccus sp. HB161399]|uniref:flavin reductase family protein n=1 Tax=Mangrovicoccus sp. HB161399 TaxID=2720392 RepID=UPI001552013E|nr:flavin reductase family protein [Mangrovicoccus sp. HB161399]
MTETTTIDPRLLRDACGRFATGVTVITTRSGAGDFGMTANAFMSVSLDPPLIAVSLGRKARMLAEIRAARRYAVNVLAGDMEPVAMHFAGRHDPALASVLGEEDGLPVLAGAAAVFHTDVVQEIEAGDHVLFIGHVRRIAQDADAPPLLFHAGRFGLLAPPRRAA